MQAHKRLGELRVRAMPASTLANSCWPFRGAVLAVYSASCVQMNSVGLSSGAAVGNS